MHSADVEEDVFGLKPDERFTVLGSPSHSLWSYVQFRADRLGASFLGIENPTLGALRRWNTFAPNVVYAVPELLSIAAAQLHREGSVHPSVRVVLLGGGPMSSTFPVDRVRSVFPAATLWSFYGAAETSFIGYGGLGEAYRPFPSVEVDLRGEGRIWVRSPMTISPADWIDTGDLGQWSDPPRFVVLGRGTRQLVVKGKKFAVEPQEQELVRAFGLVHAALICDESGRICCLVAGAPEGLGLKQVNATLQAGNPLFPLARRLVAIEHDDWPGSSSGKTNFAALQPLIDRLEK